MNKAERIHRSEAARKRRKETKNIIQERTENLYSRLRKLRKKGKSS